MSCSHGLDHGERWPCQRVPSRRTLRRTGAMVVSGSSSSSTGLELKQWCVLPGCTLGYVVVVLGGGRPGRLPVRVRAVVVVAASSRALLWKRGARSASPWRDWLCLVVLLTHSHRHLFYFFYRKNMTHPLPLSCSCLFTFLFFSSPPPPPPPN